MKSKLQFALGLTSPFVGATAFTAAVDAYLLLLGADVQRMAVATTLFAVCGPACYLLAGLVLDRRKDRRPVVLLHVLALAGLTAGLVLPPTLDSVGLCSWILAVGLGLGWCLTVCFTAVGASRAEAYPGKGERSEVEALSKFTSGFGVLFAMGLMLLLLADPSINTRGPVPCIWNRAL